MVWLTLALLLGSVRADEGIALLSPGFPASRLDPAGRLVEDWGAVSVRVTGEGVPVHGPVVVEAIRLAEVVPAAQAILRRGPLTLTVTGYRAPVWPAGMDVLTVRVEAAEECAFRFGLDLPEGAVVGPRAVTLGGRLVMVLPDRPLREQPLRDWGHWDSAVPLPGWARPARACDPSFANIRAGLGGVPILYRFRVEPGAAWQVALGLCESHWTAAGQRPLVCRVEGAAPQVVDPIARWGRHEPGVLLFDGRDGDGSGWLDVIVVTTPDSPDQNPILNAIWLFPPHAVKDPDAVASGRLNTLAWRQVDAGGPTDSSLCPDRTLEYEVRLSAGGQDEWQFWLASPGATLPDPTHSAWTAESLLAAAIGVWKERG